MSAIAARSSVALPFGLPVGALMFPCPLVAAVILVHHEDGPHGVRELLNRVFSWQRIRPRRWYLPILFLIPATYLLLYGVMRALGRPLPEPRIPYATIPLLVVVYVFSAAAEEIGWTGYAIDPLQERWSAFSSSVIVGSVWATWHVVPDLQAHRTLTWIVAQRLCTLLWRVLIVWLYNNTGRSFLAATIFHATDNVSYSLFPNNGSHYDPVLLLPIAAVTVAVVTLIWGPKTFARFKFRAIQQQGDLHAISAQPVQHRPRTEVREIHRLGKQSRG